VLLNQSTSLSVSATILSGSLSYQWYRSNTNSNTGGTLIGGATSSSYLPPVNTLGTTYYYVIVKNTDPTATGVQTATTTSRAAKVTVSSQIISSSTIQEIINDFNTAIANKTLKANGPDNKANVIGKMLEDIQDKINGGQTQAAINKLNVVYKFMDGNKAPKDMVIGSAAPALASKIKALMNSLK
jgi:hypothetical protein